MSNSLSSSFFSCVSDVARAIAVLVTASLIFLWSKWDHMCRYTIEVIQRGNMGSCMFCELDSLRANGMVILYEYFGVPLQTTTEVRRKSKGGTSPVSSLPARPAATGESARDAGHWGGPNGSCQKGHGTDTPGEVTWKRQIFRKDVEVFRKILCGRHMLTEDSKGTKEAGVMPSLPPSLEPARRREHKCSTLCWDAFKQLRKRFCLCAELFWALSWAVHQTPHHSWCWWIFVIPLPGFKTRPISLSQYPTSCQRNVYHGHWTGKAKPQSISGSLQSSFPLVRPVSTVSPVKNNHFPFFRASFKKFSPRIVTPHVTLCRKRLNFTLKVVFLLPNLFLTSPHLFYVGVKFSLT